MGGKLFTLSARKLRTFLACRKQYHLRYVLEADGDPPPPSPDLVVGTAVHAALARLTETNDVDIARRALERKLRQNGPELAHPGTEAYERAVRLFEAGVEAHHQLDGIDARAEVESHAPWPSRGISLQGRLDRFERTRTGGYRVVDWKTGRQGITEADDLQLGIVSVIARTCFRVPREEHVEAIVWNLHTGQKAVYRLLRSDATETLEYVARIADEIREATEFPATPGPFCRWCEYRLSCSEAAVTVEDWLEDRHGEGTAGFDPPR